MFSEGESGSSMCVVIEMLMKIVTLASRRLRLVSGQLVDYLEG